ncbi:MAG: hypothetical protein IT453_04755 [Planctomycetes bacterium]|nr:hypothetical protein [Planctomycetota bacterium]
MRAAITVLGLGLVALSVWAWFAFESEPNGPAAARPSAHPTPTDSERAPAQVGGRPSETSRAPLGAATTPTAPAPAEPSDGGEDAAPTSDDAAYARKYAGATATELEAALDELAQTWHSDRAAAVDQALAAGLYDSFVVAPSELDARLRELSDAATRDGALFTSRTVPYGQGVMLELQFVRLTRGGHPELFARGDEVRWLEHALERNRREDER